MFHAYAVPVPPATPLGIAFTVDEERVRASAQRSLETVAERLRARWLEETGGEVPVHVDVVVTHGGISAGNAIVAEARNIGAARIYVGTLGRKGVGRLLLGSVAELVLRSADVPVVVVHAATEEAASAGIAVTA